MSTSSSSSSSENGDVTHRRRAGSRLVRHQSDAGGAVPVGFFSVIRTVTVDFVLPDDVIITVDCVGNHTVAQIKIVLLERMVERSSEYERFGELNFVLTYELEGATYEICDMQQTFQTLRVVNSWSASAPRCNGKLFVGDARAASNGERTSNMRLGALMGVIWGKYGAFAGERRNGGGDDDEVFLTRRKLTNVRRRAVAARHPLGYAMEALLDDARLLPCHVTANIDENQRIQIEMHGPSKLSHKMSVNIDSTPASIVRQLFDELSEDGKIAFGIDDDVTAYVIKVCGVMEYVWGEYKIIDFAYIRQCVAQNRAPQLVVGFPPDPSRDRPRDEDDAWNLVDESTGVTENHQQLTMESRKRIHTEIVAFSLWDMTRKFRLKILGIDYLTINEELLGQPDEIYVEVNLYLGKERLAMPVLTEPLPVFQDMRWGGWLQFDVVLRNLPKEARLNANVVGVFPSHPALLKNGVKEIDGKYHVTLHWANMQLLNHRSILCTGHRMLKTWPMMHNEDVSFETHNGTTAPNDDEGSSELHIELDSYMHPVVFPNGGWSKNRTSGESPPQEGSPEWKCIMEILQGDALGELDDDSKRLLRKHGKACTSRANSLPKVLQACEGGSLDGVVQMHALLDDWPPISVEVALELLDARYVDEKVRSLAVKTLQCLSNQKLLAYLLQLTQALKFEPYHDSALARFLLTRALRSKRVGHFFFWFLRSEIENPHVSLRYSVLLEAYLRGAGERMLEEFCKQTTAVNLLKNLSHYMTMKHGKGAGVGSKANEHLRESLSKLQLPARFQAPFDPRVVFGPLVPDRAKIMDSKKRPLWLEFENGDDSATGDKDGTLKIIFKQGDDLRQDMLTLQMLSLMGQLWNEEGLDLCLLPYGCMSTGLQMGMIQIVPNATTVARIQKESGGLIRGTFKDEVLRKWLERKNPDRNAMSGAGETFLLSCAGYCVATYVLGIGDRHNDNIMVTESGNLFHIDFGHFLGNTKRFYGIQRERVPFVLTPDFVYVMGTEESDMFQKFKDVSVRAYLVIRRHAPLFLNLFHMMKSTGIPELNSVRDIRYLQEVLVLRKSEEEAADHFLAEIASVLRKSWTVQVNWVMHRIAHAGN